MSRYRKSMRQAMEEGLSNMQIAILKREYAPFKGKTISAARARHNCDNPGPKTKARYWSCYQWRAGAKVNN